MTISFHFSITISASFVILFSCIRNFLNSWVSFSCPSPCNIFHWNQVKVIRKGHTRSFMNLPQSLKGEESFSFICELHEPLSFTENMPLASHPLSCLPPPPSDFFMLHFRSCGSLTYEYIRNSFITWVKPRGAASAISMQMNCCLLCFVRQYMFIYSA